VLSYALLHRSKWPVSCARFGSETPRLNLSLTKPRLLPIMVVVKHLERQLRSRSGINIDQIIYRFSEVARHGNKPEPIRSEIQHAAQEAVRAGLLSTIPSNSGATCFCTTDVFHDLLIFFGGSNNFNEMLLVAREDDRFIDFFQRIELLRERK
jgi:hypothetical protein